MKPKLKPGLMALEKELKEAREWIVERTLVAYLEDIENRVPTDAELEEHHFWVQFADTPLSRYQVGDVVFTQYFVWRRRYVLAAGFLDPKKPLELRTFRVPESVWPPALRLYIEQYPNRTTGTA